MSPNSPLIVRIERPEKSLGEAMSEIRSWLDNHKIQPADFKSGPGDAGAIAFSIRFAREHEARLFEKEFV